MTRLMDHAYFEITITVAKLALNLVLHLPYPRRCQRLWSSMSSDTVPGHPSMMTSCGTLRDGFLRVKQELEEEEKRLNAELDDFQLH